MDMEEDFEITLGTEEDIPGLSVLLGQLFSQEEEFCPDNEAQSRGLRLIIADPRAGFILVGKVKGRCVAMVNILFTVSTALGERVAILEDMVVDEHHRNSGQGSRLMERAVSEARKCGCRRITLLTDASNVAGHRFYKKHGFALSSMIPFRLILES